MIHSDKGRVMISGNKVNLMMELTTLFKGLIEKDIFDEAIVLKCWKLANLSDDEIKRQADEAAVDIIHNMVPELLAYAASGNNDAMDMLDEIMPDLEKYMEKREKGDA